MCRWAMTNRLSKKKATMPVESIVSIQEFCWRANIPTPVNQRQMALIRPRLCFNGIVAFFFDKRFVIAQRHIVNTQAGKQNSRRIGGRKNPVRVKQAESFNTAKYKFTE